jgi:hypothetical protein
MVVAIIGVFGIGGLAVALAYGNFLWSRKRMDAATRHEQAKTVRERIIGKVADGLLAIITVAHHVQAL